MCLSHANFSSHFLFISFILCKQRMKSIPAHLFFALESYKSIGFFNGSTDQIQRGLAQSQPTGNSPEIGLTWRGTHSHKTIDLLCPPSHHFRKKQNKVILNSRPALGPTLRPSLPALFDFFPKIPSLFSTQRIQSAISSLKL